MKILESPTFWIVAICFGAFVCANVILELIYR